MPMSAWPEHGLGCTRWRRQFLAAAGDLPTPLPRVPLTPHPLHDHHGTSLRPFPPVHRRPLGDAPHAQLRRGTLPHSAPPQPSPRESCRPAEAPPTQDRTAATPSARRPSTALPRPPRVATMPRPPGLPPPASATPPHAYPRCAISAVQHRPAATPSTRRPSSPPLHGILGSTPRRGLVRTPTAERYKRRPSTASRHHTITPSL